MNHCWIVPVLAIAACKSTVNQQDVVMFVEKRVAQLGLPGAKVTCPDKVEAKTGNTFTCQVAFPAASYDLNVTITDKTDDKVNIDTAWAKGEAIQAAKLAGAMAPELEKSIGKVSLDCGADPLMFLDDNRNASCAVVAGDVKASLLVTFDQTLNPTKWKLEPKLVVVPKIEAMLVAEVSKTVGPIEVKCFDQPLVPRPADGKVTCVAKKPDGQTGKLTVEVDEDLNLGRWVIE